MIRLLDTLALGLPAAAWGFWWFYEGSTPLDINARLTFPLLVAAELTALALLYGVWRWHRIRGGGMEGVRALLARLYSEEDKSGDKGDRKD